MFDFEQTNSNDPYLGDIINQKKGGKKSRNLKKRLKYNKNKKNKSKKIKK